MLTNPVQSPSGPWVELYNPGDASVSLGDWQIAPSVELLAAGQAIAPHGYLVLSLANSQIDARQAVISLLDANRAVVDSVSPPPLPADQSYARLPDGSSSWVVSGSPSPGGPNVATAAAPDLQATVFAIETQIAAPLPGPPPAPVFDDGSLDAADIAGARRTRTRKGTAFQTLPISAIRGLPDDTPVITSGVVTMPTGLWDAQRAYIQANGAGILIHSFGATPLHLGDALAIKGRVHHFRGEVEIAAVRGGEQTAPGGVLPAARGVQAQDVGGGTEALLVQVGGSVSAVQRDYATIGGDSGSARVFLYSKLGLEAKALKVGDAVSVTGVVNAAENSAPASARGYAQRVLTSTHRLVPRAPGDVLVSGVPLGPLPAGSRPAPGRTAAAKGTAETGLTASGVATEASAVTSTPTAFVTPVLSSRQAAPAATAALSSENVLVLRRPEPTRPPVWVWAAIVLTAGLLASVAVVVIRRRAGGAQRP